MTEPAGSSANLTGTSIGRFQIRARLGSGGMGEVYLADDTQLKRLVAVKRMALHLGADQRYRQRFLREAQMASRLNNPYIAGIYDVFEREGEIFLVMEYVEGKPLRQYLTAPMKLEQFLPIAIECARGLAAAHAQGVLHRDIKPENIMITPAGHVKILDFGLARRLEEMDETVSFQTEAGALAGTAGYIAPEVLQEGKPDTRSDIFALGVVFYEALSGRHPFRGKTFLTTSHRVLKEMPPPLDATNRGVPPEINWIIAKMLAKDPAERYPTAAELAAELNLYERGTASGLGMATRPQPLPRWRPGRRVQLALGGVLLLALLAALASLRPVRQRVEGWLGMAVVPGQRQLAVLPFASLGGSASQNAFAIGLTDTVTARLSELSATHSLEVVPSSDVFSRKVDTADMARRQFGVNLVLTGSLQYAGDQIRVTYALVDTQLKRQLGAKTVTEAVTDPFKVEDDVASGALKLLQVELQPAERKSFASHGTDKAAAYALYLQGMGYLQNYERAENVASAIQVFQQAQEIDPRYARALAGLGQAYWQRYELTLDPKWTGPSEQACQRAIGLEPKLAAAHDCLGTVANGTGKYQLAVEQFQEALAADATSDRAYRGLATAYEKLGRTMEAEQTFQKAIRLRPRYWAGYSWLGLFYTQHGQYRDARRMFEKVIELVPDSYQGYYDLGGVYVLSGEFAKAVPLLENSIRIRPNDSAYTNLGTAHFFLHQYAQAATNFRKSVELLPTSYVGWRNLGDGLYWTPGKRPEAVAAYRKAMELSEEALKVNPRNGYAYEILAICHAMVGEKDAAVKALAQAQALAKGDPEISYGAALVYARNGQSELAMRWLTQALTEGYSAAVARNDPALDSLHGMKGFPGPEPVSDNSERRQ
jgi:tetratricopeptide (TPR) repeat protein/TolB-like protein/predicted Ser/Thr protein kinase